MWAVIGFILSVLVLLWITAVCLFASYANAIFSAKSKPIVSWLIFGGLVAAWYFVISNAPFSVTFTGS